MWRFEGKIGVYGNFEGKTGLGKSFEEKIEVFGEFCGKVEMIVRRKILIFVWGKKRFVRGKLGFRRVLRGICGILGREKLILGSYEGENWGFERKMGIFGECEEKKLALRGALGGKGVLRAKSWILGGICWGKMF